MYPNLLLTRSVHRGCSLLAVFGLAAGICLIPSPQATATERLFTYSYEPETMPEGAMEFEQWVTLRTQRTKKIGQENFNLWELREELEYGVTDNYTLALYLNMEAESYRNALDEDVSDFSFKGLSLWTRRCSTKDAWR